MEQSLPDEILLEIFSRCRKADAFHAQFVNRKWFALAWKASTHLDLLDDLPRKYDGPVIYSQRRSGNLKSIGDLDSKRFDMSRIKTISLNNYISEDLLSSLLKLCNNLEEVIIKDIEFSYFWNHSGSMKALRSVKISTSSNRPLPLDLLTRLESLSFDFCPNFYILDDDDPDSMTIKNYFLDDLSQAVQLKTLKLIGPSSPATFPDNLVDTLSRLSNLTSLDIGFVFSFVIDKILNLSFPHLKELILHSANDCFIGSLANKFASLECLRLYGRFHLPLTSPTDKGILAGLSLKKLTLNVDINLLDSLKCLSTQSKTLEELEVMSLISAISTDAPKPFLVGLQEFKRLRKLKLALRFDTKISQSMLSPAIVGAPHLEELDLSITPAISPNLFRSFASVGPRLRSLKLSHISLTNESINLLSSLKELRHLKLLYESRADDFDYVLFKSFLASLEHLVDFEFIRDRKPHDITQKDTFDTRYIFSIVNSCKNLDSLLLDGVLGKSAVSLRSFHEACPFVSKVELR